MSRIGKKPILIPPGVKVFVEDKVIKLSGPKGELSHEIYPGIKVEIKEDRIFLSSTKEDKRTKSLWGLSRAVLSNMIKGVVDGYEKKLEIEGLGFRVQLSDDNLQLYVGYSHPVEIKAPAGIKFSVEKNVIKVSGIDKELVGQIAANIRAVKPPEPYKGKGIKYSGEKIKKKLGKKAVAVAGK